MKGNKISNFVKYSRNNLKLSQQELADKAGVGISFIRDLEQGKESLQMNKVNQVLTLFGYKTVPGIQKQIDPYGIVVNKWINVELDIEIKTIAPFTGCIIEEIISAGVITHFKIVFMKHYIKYKKKKDPSLVMKVKVSDILSIKLAS